MKRRKKPRASTGLPTYVGVDEVCAALNISRATLSRMREEGKFPEPEQISPNRIGWPVEVIKAHLAKQARSVASLGVTNPEDLKPEELVPTMRKLAARLIEQEFGEAARSEQVRVTLSKVGTNDELTSCRAMMLEDLENLCGHFSYDRCLYIAATLFPAFRETLYDSVDGAVFRDPERLREFAIAMLDDEKWTKAETGAKAAADNLKLSN